MNYEFPKIRHLDDVLPHVEDRAEFKVNYKDGYTVVNYMVSFADTFNMTGPDDVGGAIRRECRGLIFHRDGRIMSRPFHKFFNIGEREETQPHVLDFSASHTLMDKADGSMLRPMDLEGKLRWGTKAGCDTDVSNFAEDFIAKNQKYNDFALYCRDKGYTPIFEYVGPHNKVVLNYETENMILLAVRDTVSGQYLEIR